MGRRIAAAAGALVLLLAAGMGLRSTWWCQPGPAAALFLVAGAHRALVPPAMLDTSTGALLKPYPFAGDLLQVDESHDLLDAATGTPGRLRHRSGVGPPADPWSWLPGWLRGILPHRPPSAGIWSTLTLVDLRRL